MRLPTRPNLPSFIPWTRFAFSAVLILKILLRYLCGATCECPEPIEHRGTHSTGRCGSSGRGTVSGRTNREVQVFRYLPEGESKIFSVNLARCVREATQLRIFLWKLGIEFWSTATHRMRSPATVYIEGDVTKPGRYPWTNNMTVADLILVGGGLKASADPQTADLTRYSGQTYKMKTQPD